MSQRRGVGRKKQPAGALAEVAKVVTEVTKRFSGAVTGGLSGRAIGDVQDPVAAGLAAGQQPGAALHAAGVPLPTSSPVESLQQEGPSQHGALADEGSGAGGGSREAGQGDGTGAQAHGARQALMNASTRIGHALGTSMRRMGLGPDAPHRRRAAAMVLGSFLTILLAMILVQSALMSSSSRREAQQQTAADLVVMNSTLTTLTSHLHTATADWARGMAALQQALDSHTSSMQQIQSQIARNSHDLAAQEAFSKDALQQLQRQLVQQQAAYKQLAARPLQYGNTSTGTDCATAISEATHAAVATLAHPSAVLASLAGGRPLIAAKVVRHSPAPWTPKIAAYSVLHRIFRPRVRSFVLPAAAHITQPAALSRLVGEQAHSSTPSASCPLRLQLQSSQPGPDEVAASDSMLHPLSVTLDLVLQQPADQVHAITLVTAPSSPHPLTDTNSVIPFDPTVLDVYASLEPLVPPAPLAAASASAPVPDKRSVPLQPLTDTDGKLTDRTTSADAQTEGGGVCKQVQSAQLAHHWLTSGKSTVRAVTYVVPPTSKPPPSTTGAAGALSSEHSLLHLSFTLRPSAAVQAPAALCVPLVYVHRGTD